MASHGDRISSLEKATELHRETLGNNGETLKNLVAEQKEALDGRASLYERMSSVEKRAGSNEAELSKHRARVSRLAARTTDLSDDIVAMSGRLDRAAEAHSIQGSNVATNLQGLSAQRERLERVERVIGDVRGECEANVNSWLDTVEKIKALREDFHDEIARVEGVRQDLSARTDELHGQVETLREEVGTIEELRDDIDELRKDVGYEPPHKRAQTQRGLVTWETFQALERRVAEIEGLKDCRKPVGGTEFVKALTQDEWRVVRAMRAIASD